MTKQKNLNERKDRRYAGRPLMRLVGWLLTAGLILGLIQGTQLRVEAAPDSYVASVITTVGGVPEIGYPETVQALVETIKKAEDDGSTRTEVKLFSDVSLGNTDLTLENPDFILDLNGKTLSGNRTEGVIKVAENGKLTVKDSSEGKRGKILNTSFVNYSNTLKVTGGELKLEAGKITGNTGYGVLVDQQGSFEISGGTISGSGLSAGVYVLSTGSLSMSAGEISGCGGAGVLNMGTFGMSDGRITGNTDSGVHNTGRFTMQDNALITGNSSTNSAGGVFNAGTFFLIGGKITDNMSGTGAGGVYQCGTLKVSGNPVVSGNTGNEVTSNVRLGDGYKIEMAGALLEGAVIGVTTEKAPAAGKQVVFTSSTEALPASESIDFFSSDAGYAVAESTEDENELALAIPHNHDFLYFAAGSKITAACREAGCTVPAYSVTLEMKAPELTTYGGEESPEMVLDGLDKFTKETGMTVDPDSIVYEGTGDTVYPECETAPTGAGTYKATLSVGDMTISTEYSIEKEEVSIKEQPQAAEDLYYTGEMQNLVTEGETEDGTLVYALGENDETAPSDGYTEEVPEMDKAGTYYVWYKVVGDENHDDTEPVCIVVVIAAKEVTNLHILMDEETFTYDGTAKEPAVTVLDGTKEIPKEEYEVTYENNVNVGTEALVHVVNVEGSNYIFDSTAYFEILEPPYSYEWVRGKWYNKDGSQTYEPLGSWKKTGQDWMYVDESGWYPKNRWQKIDFKYYYFDANGIMEKNAYRNGWYLKAGGAWDGEAKAKGWKKTSGGWQYVLADGTLLSKTWMKIDGYWYYFYDTGIAAEGAFVQGWWLDFGSCRQTWPYQASWHKNSKGWWYGDESGWYAKKNTYTIDGVKYTFDAEGYWKES